MSICPIIGTEKKCAAVKDRPHLLIAVQGKDELKFMGRDYWNQENKELINQGPRMFNLIITLGPRLVTRQ